MKTREHRWEELSELTYRFYTANFSWKDPEHERDDISIVSFHGTDDSAGRFMSAVASGAVELWLPNGLIYDLREFEYTWGDTMLEILNVGFNRWADGQEFPIAIVVSDLNRASLTTLVHSPASVLFETLEAAAAAIEEHYPDWKPGAEEEAGAEATAAN